MAYSLVGSDEGAASARRAPRVRRRCARATATSLFGQSCLAARRLVEAGSKFVTVFWDEFGLAGSGWDTHWEHYPRMRNELMPGFDRGFAGLITDLDQRGMLDETLVLVLSEHGRTPKMNNAKGGGRDHWSQAYSVLLAGGGIARGKVVGKTDTHRRHGGRPPGLAEGPARDRVSPPGLRSRNHAHRPDQPPGVARAERASVAGCVGLTWRPTGVTHLWFTSVSFPLPELFLVRLHFSPRLRNHLCRDRCPRPRVALGRDAAGRANATRCAGRGAVHAGLPQAQALTRAGRTRRSIACWCRTSSSSRTWTWRW